MRTLRTRQVVVAVGLFMLGAVVVAGYQFLGSPSGEARADGLPSAPALEVYAAQAPPGQAEAFSDGRVTMAEYDAAILKYAACGEEAGFASRLVPAKGLRVTRVSFEVPDADGKPDGDTVRSAEERLAACRVLHTDAIQSAWAEQREEPAEAAVVDLYDWLESCTAGSMELDGTVAWWGSVYRNAPKGRTLDIAPPLRLRYMQCAAEAEAITGLQAPPPFARPAGLPRP